MRKLRSAGAALFVALFLALAFCVTGAFAQSAQVSTASQSVTTHSVAVVHTRTVRPFGAFRVRPARVSGFRRFGAFRVNTFRAARFGLRARFFRAGRFFRHHRFFRHPARVHAVAVSVASIAGGFGDCCCDSFAGGFWGW